MRPAGRSWRQQPVACRKRSPTAAKAVSCRWERSRRSPPRSPGSPPTRSSGRRWRSAAGRGSSATSDWPARRGGSKRPTSAGCPPPLGSSTARAEPQDPARPQQPQSGRTRAPSARAAARPRRARLRAGGGAALSAPARRPGKSIRCSRGWRRRGLRDSRSPIPAGWVSRRSERSARGSSAAIWRRCTDTIRNRTG